MRGTTDAAATFRALLRTSPVLVWGAAACAAMFAVALLGLGFDQRVLLGAPIWLKPAKFGSSGVIFLLTLAWMTRQLPRTAMRRVAETAIGCILSVEILLVCVQAARGTTSHFNIDTLVDARIYQSMGFGIGTLWVASAVLLWQHWRTPLADRSLALAFRLGLLIQIFGAGVGWTMTRPFPGQVEAIQQGERPRIAGAHTVGGQDGGPGLPVTGWSTQHGDLRVPHFFGMHALQLMPFLLLSMRAVRRPRGDSAERRLLIGVSGAYAIMVLVMLQQALVGVPLIAVSPGGP